MISEAGDISYTAGSDVNITAGKNTYSEDSKSSEKTYSVTGGTSGGFGGSFGTSRDWSKADEVSWVNSVILAENGNVSINTNEDVTVRGGNIYGDTVDIEAENLTIESLQNTINNKSGGHGFNVGLTVNTGPLGKAKPAPSGGLNNTIQQSTSGSKVPSGQVGFSERSGYHDAAWVEDQSSIVSNGELTVSVKDKTELIGAVLGSETGDMTLSTGELSYEDIEDHNYSRNKSTSVNTSTGSVNPIETILSPSGETTISKSDEGEKKDQTTKATIGEGTIVINGEEQDNDSEALEGLNRDLDATQVITRDEKTGGLNYTITVDHAIAAKVIAESLKGAASITKETLNIIALLSTGGKKELFLSLQAAAFNGNVDLNIKFLEGQIKGLTDQDDIAQAESYLSMLKELQDLSKDMNPSTGKKILQALGFAKSQSVAENEFYDLQARIPNHPFYDDFKDSYNKAIVDAWGTNPKFQDAVENFPSWSESEQRSFLAGLLKDGQDIFGKDDPSSFYWGALPGKTGEYDPNSDTVSMSNNMGKYSDDEIKKTGADPTGNRTLNVLGVLGHEMAHSLQYYLARNSTSAEMQGDLWRLSLSNNYIYNGNSGDSYDFAKYAGQSHERDAVQTQDYVSWGLKRFYMTQTQNASNQARVVTNSVLYGLPRR
ncbi:hemagluttinin repeat-containing protein [Parelusimicrobium proximum]